MVNMSVQIGGITLRNPVLTGSGTFGFGSEMANVLDLSHLGAIVVKSTSREPRLGNPTPRIVETPGGILNAIGLQNGGVDDFIQNKLPFLRTQDVPIIVNLVGYSVDDYVFLAEKLTNAGGVHGLEINISCPNVQHGCDFAVAPDLTGELLAAVRRVTPLTLITKLSPNVTDMVPVAQAAMDNGSDALSLINTVLGTSIDVRKRKFRLANITGGLSGPAVKPIALRCVWQVHRALPRVPLIGMGGIMTATDAVEFLLAGASAMAVGTATFVTPTAAVDIAQGLEQWCVDNGVEDVADLVGAAT